MPQTHETHETFETIHKLIAKLLIYGMIPLHVLAALKHQFVDKDAVVQHMVPGLTPKPILNWRWLLPVGIVAAAVGLGYGIYRGAPEKGGEGGAPSGSGLQSSATSAVAPAMNADASTSSLAESSSLSASSTPVITNWAVDKSATKIGWTTTFEGEAIAGGFNSYIAQIAFDPAALDASSVKVTIDLASVASGDNDRDTSLKSDSFFNTSAFPKAVFEARSFTKKDATHFIAHGKLTLHGVTKAQDLPFTLTIKDKVANMTATTTLDRTAFGVGSGDYASTDTIPAKVGINITLQAKAES
ncbi:MAG: YceI family protein [Asticcacaulis sp.]